jgi:hypothetical protein
VLARKCELEHQVAAVPADAGGDMMLRAAVFTIALSLAAGTAVLAQLPPQPPPVANPLGQGNDRERAACHPDVMRYCRELVKDDDQADVFAILSCLQTNRTRISGACRQVLASHGQ